MAEWKAGASYGQLFRAHGIPKGTVQRWANGDTRMQVVATLKKPEPYNLDLMAVKLIDGSVSAVSAIHGVTEDANWLRHQSASELAILLGVISDKLYRLLEAIHPTTVDGAAVIPTGVSEDS